MNPDIQIFNQKILPKISQIHQVIYNFHGQQIQQFQQIINNIENVGDDLREKQEECETYINEIKSKRKEQEKLGQISKGVLEAKSEEIKSKIKNIEAVGSGIKQSVGKVKPEKLAKLPVQKDRTLKKLFNSIYEAIYPEDNKEFDWERFKKLALKHEDGEDFIFRLVNINYKDLSPKNYDKLMELKNDPQFEKISVKSEHSYDIIDLADWVDYVCLGHQFSLEKKRAEKDYDKIRKNVDKKSKGSLQMSQNFWKEASTEIETYQSQIQSINSQFKTIVFGLKKSIQTCNSLTNRTKQRIIQISN